MLTSTHPSQTRGSAGRDRAKKPAVVGENTSPIRMTIRAISVVRLRGSPTGPGAGRGPGSCGTGSCRGARGSRRSWRGRSHPIDGGHEGDGAIFAADLDWPTVRTHVKIVLHY